MGNKKTSQLPLITPTVTDSVPLYDPEGNQTGRSLLQAIKDLIFSTNNNTGWISNLAPSVSSVNNNGQRSYAVVFASSVATLLSPGMRVRLTRGTTAPTQCTSLNGSTQYWSKSSPSGVTFTGNFTCSAWIKLTSYGSGGIIDRDSAAGTASGWSLNVNSTGQLVLFWRNGSGATSFTSTQALPLNRWIHVAAIATVATPTVAFYIDGINVAGTSSATAATTVVQPTTALTIGNRNSTSAPFPGKIAQAAVFSAALSGATILSYMSQTLSGSETNLVSAFSFNGTANDLSANANNLSASGSAVATNSDSPFAVDANGTPGGTYEYGIVTKVSGSTATVQVPEGCAIPTSGSISAVDVSSTKAPYGMPIDEGRWTVVLLLKSSVAKSSGISTSTWYNTTGLSLLVPAGQWLLGLDCCFNLEASGTIVFALSTLSTAASSESDSRFTTFIGIKGASGTITNYETINVSQDVNLSAATAYYLLEGTFASGAPSTFGYRGDLAPTQITARCALL